MNSKLISLLNNALEFQSPAQDAIAADNRRIILVGASGWLGRTVLAGLRSTLGEQEMKTRVVCFGSAEKEICYGHSRTFSQRPLSDLPMLSKCESILFHLAFLTKDKISGMDESSYCASNRNLSSFVLKALDVIGVDRLFVASSGAAAFADEPSAAADLRLYGSLKLEDERRFSDWASSARGRCALILRIYSLSGPFINKHDTYALASFILDALAGRPISVMAKGKVVRSYVAAIEIASAAFAHLLTENRPTKMLLDTGGEPLEIADIAGKVAEVLGGKFDRRLVTNPSENVYTGDVQAYKVFLRQLGLVHTPFEQQVINTAAYLQQYST